MLYANLMLLSAVLLSLSRPRAFRYETTNYALRFAEERRRKV